MNMSGILKKSGYFAAGAAAFAAIFLLFPGAALAQESLPTEITVVTGLYKLESLLPEMSSGELGTIKDISSWCLDMAQYFKDRLTDARKQVDLQRETKRAEIKALEARVKSAGKAKDGAAKKALEAEVKAQKVELEILDALKDITTQEDALSGDFDAAGRSLRSLAGSFQDLTDSRNDALRAYERASQEAAQAGLAAPALVIGYPANDKAMKSIGEAGKNVKDLGDRLMKLSKARQGLVGAWEKLEKAKAGK